MTDTYIREDGVEMVPMLNGILPPITLDEYREALRCEKCGHDTYADPQSERPCINGNCVELFCNGCGWSNGGWGPVGCGCDDSQPINAWRELAAGLRWFFVLSGAVVAVLGLALPFGWIWGPLGYEALASVFAAYGCWGFRLKGHS